MFTRSKDIIEILGVVYCKYVPDNTTNIAKNTFVPIIKLKNEIESVRLIYN